MRGVSCPSNGLGLCNMEVEGSFETPSENPSCGAHPELTPVKPEAKRMQNVIKKQSEDVHLFERNAEKGVNNNRFISGRGLAARMSCRRTDEERQSLLRLKRVESIRGGPKL